jgi:hypothetical protein
MEGGGSGSTAAACTSEGQRRDGEAFIVFEDV